MFCLSCGRPTSEKGLEPIEPPSGSWTDTRSTLLLMFSIMLLFFGLFLLFPAYFLDSRVVYLICTTMVAGGIIMLLVRFFLLRRYSKKVEVFRAEAAEKIKCKYCGSMNALDAERCIGCHAPL